MKVGRLGRRELLRHGVAALGAGVAAWAGRAGARGPAPDARPDRKAAATSPTRRTYLSREAGAVGPVRLRDVEAMLAGLKREGIDTIGRVVVFKDNVLAHHRPAWAVLDTRTGTPWLDREGLAWVDPFRADAWEYPISVAREAVDRGFDEIHYLRFPGDGPLAAARYATANTGPARRRAITAFLERARGLLAPTGAALAVDVFGYTAFNTDDTGIGVRLEELAPFVGWLCPMAYPSSYHRGIPGYPDPVAHPYEVVFETVRRTRQRTTGLPVRVRPWVQDFRDYPLRPTSFGVTEVRAQIRAASDADAAGFMLWNSRNVYTAGARQRKESRAWR